MEATQLIITDEAFIQPLNEVLTDNTPKPPEAETSPKEPNKSFQESLDHLFPEQKREERDIRQAKEVLGPIAAEFSNEHLKDVIIEVRYLAESWLDDFERDIFGGKTLNELLHEKGGL